MVKDFYTVKEFADVYGCSPDRVYEWLRAGKIRHYERPTPHAIYRIPKTELARWKGEERATPKEVATHQPMNIVLDSGTVIDRREHFAELANIAKSLLLNGLENVSCPGWTTNRSQEVKYLIPNQDATSGYDEITKEQLANQLNSNMSTILKDKEWFFRYRFVPYVKGKLSTELKKELFSNILEENPYQLIEVLRRIVYGEAL